MYVFTVKVICKEKVLAFLLCTFWKLINISPKIINIYLFPLFFSASFHSMWYCSNLVHIPWMCDNNNCIDNRQPQFHCLLLNVAPFWYLTSISIGMWTHCIMSLEIFPVNSIFSSNFYWFHSSKVLFCGFVGIENLFSLT